MADYHPPNDEPSFPKGGEKGTGGALVVGDLSAGDETGSSSIFGSTVLTATGAHSSFVMRVNGTGARRHKSAAYL